MTISENIAVINFELVLKNEPTNKLLDTMEELLKGNDELYFPLRVFLRSGKHIFCLIETSLKEETNIDTYTEDTLYKLQEFGEVRDLRIA